MKPEILPEPSGLPRKEFSERAVFNTYFGDFVGHLGRVDGVLASNSHQELPRPKILVGMERWLHRAEENLPAAEAALLRGFWGLFCRKHSLPPFFSEEQEFIGRGGAAELTVEIGGSLAVGKSTIADFLAEQIGARKVGEVFAPGENPFLAAAYQNPALMLRTQLGFLLGSLEDGLRTRCLPGRWVRDNSRWSDRIFKQWRVETGAITSEESQLYDQLFAILESVISKPDLLIMLKPNSLERLWEGLQARIQADSEARAMERVVTEKDLAIVSRLATEAVRALEEKGINVMEITVDPIEVWRNPDLKYSTVYAVREKLGILKELLTKDPQEVAEEIVSLFARNSQSQVTIVHSRSMFSGKTSVLNFVAERVKREHVLVFQPQAAIRYGEEHQNNMIDRDRRKTPARTITSNKIQEIVSWIEGHKIEPKDYPFIFIDEVMLFWKSNENEVIWAIENLRFKGFNVIVDGIDYTFQEKPFTFMHDLVAEVGRNPNWHHIEMGTSCKYCNQSARGSRRLKADGSIAHFGDSAFEAGEHYEPVCGDKHPSCLGQPNGFVRQPLPAESI